MHDDARARAFFPHFDSGQRAEQRAVLFQEPDSAAQIGGAGEKHAEKVQHFYGDFLAKMQPQGRISRELYAALQQTAGVLSAYHPVNVLYALPVNTALA